MTCPGAYSCNLALTKSDESGRRAGRGAGEGNGSGSAQTCRARERMSECLRPALDWRFRLLRPMRVRSTARKCRIIRCCSRRHGLGRDPCGLGLQIQSLPARLVPEAVDRVIRHFQANREAGESFRGYVLRHKVETFRKLTADLAKPAELFPEIYQDWGDEMQYSLKLGRGECAA